MTEELGLTVGIAKCAVGSTVPAEIPDVSMHPFNLAIQIQSISRDNSHLHSWPSAVVARVVRSNLITPLSRCLGKLAVGTLVVPSWRILCGG